MVAAGQVLVPGPRLLPPRLGPLVVDAPGAHRHAGLAVEPGLMGVAVEDEAVDAVAEGHVAQGLHRKRMVHPFGHLGDGRERFGAEDVACRRCARRRPSPCAVARPAPPVQNSHIGTSASAGVGEVRPSARRRRPRSTVAGRAGGPTPAAARRSSRRSVRRSSSAGPTGTVRRPPAIDHPAGHRRQQRQGS